MPHRVADAARWSPAARAVEEDALLVKKPQFTGKRKRNGTTNVKEGSLVGETTKSKHHDLGQDLVLELAGVWPFDPSMQVFPNVAQKVEQADDVLAPRKDSPDGLSLGEGLVRHHELGLEVGTTCATGTHTHTYKTM